MQYLFEKFFEIFFDFYIIFRQIYEMNVKISGIEMTESTWEMSAIPDATVVSLPYALGITMVFRPSGIASDATAHTKKLFESSSPKSR